MAKKNLEYIVIDGCIQEGKERYMPGQLYTPPTAALRDELLAGGVIAEVKDPAAQAVLRAIPPKVSKQPVAGGEGGEGGEGGGGGAGDGDGQGGEGNDLLNQGGGS